MSRWLTPEMWRKAAARSAAARKENDHAMSTNAKGRPTEKLIDARELFPGEELRVALSPYRGQVYFGARRWFLPPEGEDWRPGKGLSVHVRYLPWLRRAILEAEREALSGGELQEQDYELAGLPLPPELGGEAA